MYRVRHWSTRNARWLAALYDRFESLLTVLHPLFVRVGYRRLEPLFAGAEKVAKGFLFDCRACGQCTLGASGLTCPMNCPKSLRNGPCGGVRADGHCEIKPDMPCVWLGAWEGSQRMRDGLQEIQVIQPPLDNRLLGRSSWLSTVRARREGAVDTRHGL